MSFGAIPTKKKRQFPYIPASAVISSVSWQGASYRKLRVQHSGQASSVAPARPTMKDVRMYSVVKPFQRFTRNGKSLLNRKEASKKVLIDELEYLYAP